MQVKYIIVIRHGKKLKTLAKCRGTFTINS